MSGKINASSNNDSRTIIAARLSRAEIFGDLSQEELLAIADFCHEEVRQENESVLVEGQTAERLFVVERGKLALEKKIQIGRHSTPRNATVGYVGPGKMAGFSALAAPHVFAT